MNWVVVSALLAAAGALLSPPSPRAALGRVRALSGVHEWSHALGELGNHSFSLVSYNTLAPLNGEGPKHSYAAVAITKWTRRREKVVDEIRALRADVLCLQEVSVKSLKETFIPKLRTLGLECCAYAAAKTANKASGKYAHRQIGCAVFIRESKLEALDAKRVHLRDFAPLSQCHSHDLVAAVQSRFDAMALVHLRVRATNASFIVGNAHLYWNPARADIKAVQAYAAMEAIERFARHAGFPSAADAPVVLAGDLNTMPSNRPFSADSYDSTEASAPFELFGTGALPSSHPEHPDTYFSSLPNGAHPQLGAFQHSFNMTNVYLMSEFESQKPLFTTKTDDFQGWIDHVWVNSRVRVDAVLVPPVRAGDLEAGIKARAFKPIPSLLHPSDHLPVGMVASIPPRLVLDITTAI